MQHETQSPARLEDVGILDLLAHDDRPTFILENNPTSAQMNSLIVFRNKALDAHVHGHATEFECWARVLSIQTLTKSEHWTFGGRNWAHTAIHDRWIIVYCSQVDLAPVKVPGLQSHDREPHSAQHATNHVEVGPSEPEMTSHKHSQDVSASDQGDKPRTAPPRFPCLGREEEEVKILDWTRFHIAGLTPYIQYLKQYDWTSTHLGPMSAWPNALRAVVVSIASHPDPRIILWGEDMLMLYNEAAVPRLANRHPIALGRPASETFAEMWPYVAPLIQPAIFDGISTKVHQELYFMDRNGIQEETYWSFVMAPLLGDNGYAQGVLDSFTEQTSTVVTQRRRDMTAHLTQATSGVTTLKELWAAFLDGLESYTVDIPYAIIYSADDGDSSSSSSSLSTQMTRVCNLEGCLAIHSDETLIPTSFDLNSSVSASELLANACRRASALRQPITLRSEDGSLPSGLCSPITGRGWGDSITHVCILPLSYSGTGTLGFLIVAMNPRRPYNDDALRFVQTVRDILARPALLISQQRFEELHDSLTQQLKLSTLEAARNEDKFTRLAESSPIGISTFLPAGETVYVNNEYLSLIGVERGYYNKSLWDQNSVWRRQIMDEDLPRIETAWRSLLERKATTVTIEYRVKRPWLSVDKATGNEIVGETWLLNKATVETDEDDNVIFIHAWLFDVSAQHFSENLMAQRLEDALHNKRQSENFIDMVSHELRNPLSAILQSADGILTVLDDVSGNGTSIHSIPRDSILDSAQTIVLCAQHQKCIVDDILTLSKLDANLLVITPDKVQPPALIDKVLKMYEAELVGKKIEAHLKIEASFTEILHNHDYVMLDPSRLLQVVINLLTNAIKFTQYMDERKITIYLGASYNVPTGKEHDLAFIERRTLRQQHSCTLSSEWGDGQELYLQITVQDTGRGLDEEEMKMLFQRFSQASPKTYKQYGGSGLGLFISRELTELQGGQIGVSSRGVGKGTTFGFYVQARRHILEEGIDAPSPVALQHIWNTPISKADVSLEAANTHVTDVPPAPTSSSSTSGQAREKPRLSRVPTNRRQRLVVSTDKDKTVTGQIHVLVVEDNLINQKVMKQQLRRIGYVVHIANHGLECLEFLRKTPYWQRASLPSTHPLESEVPDHVQISAVLMDWEMPVMDGLSCVREIRKLEASGEIVAHIPVIAATANARGEQISIAMEAGMDDLVTKPFRIPDLVPIVEALVVKHPAPALHDQ